MTNQMPNRRTILGGTTLAALAVAAPVASPSNGATVSGRLILLGCEFNAAGQPSIH